MAAKRNPEFDRFTALVDRVIAVPKAVIQEREQVLRESAVNSKKRTPKAKVQKPTR